MWCFLVRIFDYKLYSMYFVYGLKNVIISTLVQLISRKTEITNTVFNGKAG